MSHFRINILLLTLILFLVSFSLLAQNYVQVWGDEFNTPGLPDSTKWKYEIGKVRNSELQYYTSKRVENARIEDSVLVIEVRKEQYEGADYTSASIISKGIGDWKYGKVEISAKVPTGKGTWPALWMMPTYSEYGGWPRSGEIDIMEYIGVEPQNLWYNAHFLGTDGTGHDSNGSGAVKAITNPFDQFIKFTLIWTPDNMEWYANDVKYHEYNKPADEYSVWPFNKEFYLILNLAYGGKWGGYDGVNDSLLPHKFLIDYVRVYQLRKTESPFSLTLEPANGGTVEVSPQMDFYPENTQITVTAIPDSNYVFKSWQHQSAANPYTFTIRKNTTLSAFFLNESELLTNGTFDYNFQPWQFYVNSDYNTSYSAEVKEGRLIIDITQSPLTDWKLGFQELALSLQKGKYKLTFDAFATQQKQVLITVSKNYPNWSSHLSKRIDVNTNDKTYEVLLDMPTDDNNVRLFFGIGKFLGKFSIDNISLSRIIPTANNEIIELNNSSDFKIYPNPNRGEFTLEFTKSTLSKNTSLRIYNSSGVLIQSDANLKSENLINLNNTQQGIYFVQIITDSGFITKKISIK